MAGITRVLQFAEGVSTTAPVVTFLQATELAQFADDAAFVTAVGRPAQDGDIYYNTTDDVVRVYANGQWTSLFNTASVQFTLNEGGNQAAADGNSKIEVSMSDATNVSITYDSTLASRWKAGDVGSESEIMTVGTAQTVSGDKTHSGRIIQSNTTTSTSKDTGAIVTEGGVGIEENLYVGGLADVAGALDVAGVTTTGGNLQIDALVSGVSTDDAATGANATLTAPTTTTVRLTNASLTSIDMIPAGGEEQFLILKNATGSAITVNDDTGGTAANRIFTGTGNDLSLADNASILLSYDNDESRWMVVGGSGGGGVTATGDWTAYTPTGTWSTNTTYTGFYRRVGDSIEVRARVSTSGVPTTATTLRVDIPGGLTIDTAKLLGTDVEMPLGYAKVVGSSERTPGSVTYFDTNTVTPKFDNGGGAIDQVVLHNSPVNFGAGDFVDMEFTVPIVGFTTSFNAADLVFTGFRAKDSAGTAFANNTVVKWAPATEDYDTNAMYNTGTGDITIPSDGKYFINVVAGFTTVTTYTGYMYIQIEVNSTIVAATNEIIGSVANTECIQLSTVLDVSASDVVEVSLFQNNGAARSLRADGNYNYIECYKLGVFTT